MSAGLTDLTLNGAAISPAQDQNNLLANQTPSLSSGDMLS